MKVYILKSKSAIYIVNTVFESTDFWLVPVYNSNSFDIYGKDVFVLTIEDAREMKK